MKRAERPDRFPSFAGMLDRLKGPVGILNLGDALGFGAGLLIALSRLVGIHEHRRQRFFDRNAICRRKPGRRCARDSDSNLLLERGSLPSGLVERISVRSEIDAVRRSFLWFWSDCAGRGLYLLSNPFLAATSGLLHAAGKFGSAFDVRGELSFRGRKIDANALCRSVVLISRVPAIIATTADVFSAKAHDDGAFAFNAVAMLACYLIWAAADSMLLPRDSVVVRFFHRKVARKIRV